ncbi:cation channel sperm-associated protein subunit gamma-like [Polyodon spathula]|uniref:cation channel sperm-associated protein subunit gamma-like n=1 Tax=Polyodon spathula TaxID=7913 RepID=UPI001B7D93F7|nr:cation channel sperm-associated protein subunit gamma-like [Polyodon spathula]
MPGWLLSQLWPLALAVLWAPLCRPQACEWFVRLGALEDLHEFHWSLEKQQPVTSMQSVMETLTDQAVDPLDQKAKYLCFPYYIRIDLACRTAEFGSSAVREAHLSGMKPVVTVRFQEPAHPVRQKPERLEAVLTAAPLLDEVGCHSEVCSMGWYVPFPLLNGSVVYRVLVQTNGLGRHIPDKSFAMNVDGYVRPSKSSPGLMERSFGTEVMALPSMMKSLHPSRPLWFVRSVTPVLVLGGVPNNKVVLVSSTEFRHSTLVEVSIDSCWVGSLSCPQANFSSTIQDVISTESTIFIRQNQLVYRFTGDFTLLPLTEKPSEFWTRMFKGLCVERLVPVYLPFNGKEYFYVVGGGWQSGYIYSVELQDGSVYSYDIVDRDGKRPCDFVECRDTAAFTFPTPLPTFIPREQGSGFLIVTGSELFTDTPLVIRGVEFNPYSWLLILWGNALICSYDSAVTYMFFTGFPATQMIKYFALSFQGEFTFVTEDEEVRSVLLSFTLPPLSVWWGLEGHPQVVLLRPSPAWDSLVMLQQLRGPATVEQESLLTVFYSTEGQLHEVVYTESVAGVGSVAKRKIPLSELLSLLRFSSHLPSSSVTRTSWLRGLYFWAELLLGSNLSPLLQIGDINPYIYSLCLFSSPPPLSSLRQGGLFVFPYPCPFQRMHFESLPPPNLFSRIQQYRAEPPEVLDPMGFYSPSSLSIYHGLLYQLLWLHSQYNRPYGDPVHDPTWRWWKNKAMYEDYYSYLASNRLSSGGVHVEMRYYAKEHRGWSQHSLPDRIYLDRTSTYHFTVYLSLRNRAHLQRKLSSVWLAAVISNIDYIDILVTRQELINRGAVLYQVTIHTDQITLVERAKITTQSLTGLNLKSFSFTLSVMNGMKSCYQETESGLERQGYTMLPVSVGCPPGRRIAFDITYTLQYTKETNKRYFDCLDPDPEMPCFYYEDTFYPFFQIQDMVSGDSGQFLGSYTFLIIGGGPYSLDNMRHYSEEEILIYNSQSHSDKMALIWTMPEGNVNKTEQGFYIFHGTANSVGWICQTRSPCSDITADGLQAPDFYFFVEVSNRGVDTSTYCDYKLQFVIHIHGLPLNAYRGLFCMLVTMGILCSVLFCFILYQCCGHLIYQKITGVIDNIKHRMLQTSGSEVYHYSEETLHLPRGSIAVHRASVLAKPRPPGLDAHPHH